MPLEMSKQLKSVAKKLHSSPTSQIIVIILHSTCPVTLTCSHDANVLKH